MQANGLGRIIDDSIVDFPRGRAASRWRTRPNSSSLTQRLRELIMANQPPTKSRIMSPQLRRRIASATLIVDFFLLWEISVQRAFNIGDIVLP